MTYISVTHTLVDPIEKTAQTWADLGARENEDEEENLAYSRCAYLGTVPLSIFAGAIDTLIGVGSGIGMWFTALTCGSSERHVVVREFAYKHLESSSGLLKKVYHGLIKTVNPLAAVREEQGFAAGLVQETFVPIAKVCTLFGNPFIRYGASRLTLAMMFVCALVARVVDLAIGVIAALFSILTRGEFGALNNTALRNLQLPIGDLFIIPTVIINPWAFD